MPENPPPNVEVNSGTAGIVKASVDGAAKLSKFTPEQVLTIGSMLSMVVICGIMVFSYYDTRMDRRDERRESAQADADRRRSNEEAREKDRQLVILEREKDRQANMMIVKETNTSSAEREAAILKHCSDEAEKNRKFIGLLATEVGKLAGKKFPPDPEPEECIHTIFGFRIPIVAPMPRVKGSTP